MNGRGETKRIELDDVTMRESLVGTCRPHHVWVLICPFGLVECDSTARCRSAMKVWVDKMGPGG